MGRIGNTKLVKHSNDLNVQNSKVKKDYSKIVEEIQKKSLIKEVKNNNFKINEKELHFITRDKSNQIVWLEKGNEKSGLKHIINNHSEQFKNTFGAEINQISDCIKEIVTNGKIVDTKNNPNGYTKVYKHESKYYLISGIGSNGYIVTAFPYNDKGGKYDSN